jgi:hypothetical protein
MLVCYHLNNISKHLLRAFMSAPCASRGTLSIKSNKLHAVLALSLVLGRHLEGLSVNCGKRNTTLKVKDFEDYIHLEVNKEQASNLSLTPRFHISYLERVSDCRLEVLAAFVEVVFPAFAVHQERG